MLAAHGSSGFQVSSYKQFSDAPKGSVAVIPIVGPILKYGDICSAGSIDYADWVKEAAESQNIAAIILKIDSPGGMVDGTQTLVDAIKAAASEKPVVAFVDDGMMASAAMWIGSSAQEIYASQKTDCAGSIGVYTSIIDFKGYWESEGLKIHDIYAPESTEKNLGYKNALEGDYKLIETELSFIAQQFISAVKTNRTGKITSEEIFKGAMYPADQAITLGLIDGIKSFEQTVLRASELAYNKNPNNSTSKSSHSMFGNKLKAISELKGIAAADITQEQLDQANQALADNEITAVTLVNNSTIAALEKKAADAEAALKNEQDAFKAFKLERGATSAASVGKTTTEAAPGEQDPNEKYLTDADREARAAFEKSKQ